MEVIFFTNSNIDISSEKGHLKWNWLIFRYSCPVGERYKYRNVDWPPMKTIFRKTIHPIIPLSFRFWLSFLQFKHLDQLQSKDRPKNLSSASRCSHCPVLFGVLAAFLVLRVASLSEQLRLPWIVGHLRAQLSDGVKSSFWPPVCDSNSFGARLGLKRASLSRAECPELEM